MRNARKKLFLWTGDIENKKIEHEAEEEGKHKERKTKVCCTSMRISSYLSFLPLPLTPPKENQLEKTKQIEYA